jgi:hypothetical protein
MSVRIISCYVRAFVFLFPVLTAACSEGATGAKQAQSTRLLLHVSVSGDRGDHASFSRPSD